VQRRVWLPLILGPMMLLAACGGGAARPAAGASATGTAPGGRAGAAAPATSPSTAASAGSSGAAASGAGSSGGTPFVTLQGPNRTAQLEKAARAEGQVDWFTNLAGPSVQALVNAFQKAYPYITVSVDRSDAPQLVTKAAQADAVHRYVADSFYLDDTDFLVARDEHIVVPYYEPYAASVPAQFRMDAGGGLIWGESPTIDYIGFGYNTKIIPQSEAPHSLQDLLQPQWKGRLAIPTSSTGIRWVGGVYHVLGQAAGDAFLKKLAAQQVKPEAMSGAALMGLIAQGQIAASPAVFRDHTLLYAAKGAPVVWVGMPPVIDGIDMVSIGTHAPHPAAALLFNDFLLGPPGQQIFKQYHYVLTAHPLPIPQWVPTSGISSSAQMQQVYGGWQKAFKRTFQGG
jgi:iron(III) transport system substrate-binding protein